MRFVKVVSAVALGAVLGCGDDGPVDPGNPDEQACTGQISGAGSGVLQSCTLEAYRVGTELHHDFKFTVRWSDGQLTDGSITMIGEGEPAPGQYGLSGFQQVAGSVEAPEGLPCSLGAGLDADHGSLLMRVNTVPEGQDNAGVTMYQWMGGTLKATFTDPEGGGDICPGELQLDAEFGPAKK